MTVETFILSLLQNVVITSAPFKTNGPISVTQDSLRHYFIMTNFQLNVPQNNQY